MDTTVATYVLYLVLSAGITVTVVRALARAGRRFLTEAFRGDEDLADSVTRLKVIGFYLLSFGYICLTMAEVGNDVVSVREAMEVLAQKVGLGLLVLGAMHFANLYFFSRTRIWHWIVRPHRAPAPAPAA